MPKRGSDATMGSYDKPSHQRSCPTKSNRAHWHFSCDCHYVNPSSHSRIISQTSHHGQPHSHMSQISTGVRHRPSIHILHMTTHRVQDLREISPHDGFDPDIDDDDSEDASSSYTPYGSSISARTPAFRRGPNAHSLPPERESNSISERPRAQTEGGDGPSHGAVEVKRTPPCTEPSPICQWHPSNDTPIVLKHECEFICFGCELWVHYSFEIQSASSAESV
jgi:hypothetical protein